MQDVIIRSLVIIKPLCSIIDSIIVRITSEVGMVSKKKQVTQEDFK